MIEVNINVREKNTLFDSWLCSLVGIIYMKLIYQNGIYVCLCECMLDLY
jgi:hypothetical protein